MKLWLSLFAVSMLGGCVAAGYGDGDVGVGVSYVGGYYDPCCYHDGGWGHGYRVGPPHGEFHGPGGGHGPGPGRGAPSIPHGPRGGGGGFHGGGHGGGHH
jgi:hypothetical protein